MVGICAGWIAELVLGPRHSLFIKLLIGVVGSFVGAFIGTRFGLPIGGFGGELLVSSLGAALFLTLLGLLRRPA